MATHSSRFFLVVPIEILPVVRYESHRSALSRCLRTSPLPSPYLEGPENHTAALKNPSPLPPKLISSHHQHQRVAPWQGSIIATPKGRFPQPYDHAHCYPCTLSAQRFFKRQAPMQSVPGYERGLARPPVHWLAARTTFLS